MSKSEVTTNEMPNTFITDLMQHLNRRVIGQEEAKKALVGTLYQYLKHNVRHPLLMVGGTGCGKTYLINTAIKWIAETMPTVHFASRNVSRLTPAGWAGEDFEDVLCVFKTLEPGHSYIVHMDEIDKLMVPRHNSDGEDFNAAACGQVMNAISGEDQRMAGIDWSRILVVATGAFEWLSLERQKVEEEHRQPVGFGRISIDDANLTERELMEHAGVMKEFLGRFCITRLDQLGEQDMMDILCLPASEGGILEQTRELYQKEGINVVLEPGARESIAARAVKDAHGARSIQTVLHEFLGPARLVDAKLTEKKAIHIAG